MAIPHHHLSRMVTGLRTRWRTSIVRYACRALLVIPHFAPSTDRARAQAYTNISMRTARLLLCKTG